MLTILEQLIAAQRNPLPPAKEHVRKTGARERKEAVYEALEKAGSAKALHVSTTLGVKHATVKVYLRALAKEGRVVSWRTGNATWYAPKKDMT